MFAAIFNLTIKLQILTWSRHYFLIYMNVIWISYKCSGLMTIYGVIDLVSVNLGIVYDARHHGKH